MEINVRNANDMLSEALTRVKVSGRKGNSRNGPVVYIDEPVLTTVRNPTERVLFLPERDANPIFHVMESLWMLAGRRDVEFLDNFNSQLKQYSDDGEVYNAAYGYRMRHEFGVDQLYNVVTALADDNGTRQAVVQLWHPKDLNKKTKDKACNMQMIFSIRLGKVDMLVINRSNDIIYGYAGANIVHFTYIQEFVASSLGLEMGKYQTFTNNLHVYTELYPKFDNIIKNPHMAEDHNLYRREGLTTMPLLRGVDPVTFLQDVNYFCENPFKQHTYDSYFINYVARPMARAALARKNGGDGLAEASAIEAQDWSRATYDWIMRREEVRNAANHI